MKHVFDFEFEGKPYQLRAYTFAHGDGDHAYLEDMHQHRMYGFVLAPNWAIDHAYDGSSVCSDALKDHADQLLRRMYALRLFL
jgi:hypothetical protein